MLVSPPSPTLRGAPKYAPKSPAKSGPGPNRPRNRQRFGGVFRPLKETLTPTLRTKMGTLTPPSPPSWCSSGLGVQDPDRGPWEYPHPTLTPFSFGDHPPPSPPGRGPSPPPSPPKTALFRPKRGVRGVRGVRVKIAVGNSIGLYPDTPPGWPRGAATPATRFDEPGAPPSQQDDRRKGSTRSSGGGPASGSADGGPNTTRSSEPWRRPGHRLLGRPPARPHGLHSCFSYSG